LNVLPNHKNASKTQTNRDESFWARLRWAPHWMSSNDQGRGWNSNDHELIPLCLSLSSLCNSFQQTP
jgi:hypothetical protein